MKYRAPTVREYLILKYSKDVEEILAVARGFTEIKSVKGLKKFLSTYLTEIEIVKMTNPELNLPYYPEETEHKHYFNCNSQEIKSVSDYTNLNFSEVYNLNIFEFWGYLHDAAVWNLSRTEAGRDYLEKAYVNSQAEPDRESLREVFGGGKNGK